MSEHTTRNHSNFYFPLKSTLASKSLYLFLYDYYRAIDLFFFTVQLASSADHVALVASKALIATAKSDEERRKYQENIDNPEKAVKRLGEFSVLNSKNMVVTTVDAFLWFVSSSIQSAMKKRPEIVKSGESVKIEDIFDFRNKSDLINYLIDRKINSLSYGGMSKIEKFIEDSMGISIFPDDNSRELMKIFVEIRNIHVHNRGFVNELFLGRVKKHKDYSFSEGDRAHLAFDELVGLTQVCVKSAIHLDAKICKKFCIERKRYSTWRKRSKSNNSVSTQPL